MPRRKRITAKVTDATSNTGIVPVGELEPSTLGDEALESVAADPQPAGATEPQPVAVAEPAPSEPAPTFVERLSEKSGRHLMPDPFLIALDSAVGVRMFENRQRRVMAIKFDEKPAQPVIDMIKEAGFAWNPTDRVWTKPVRGDSAMSTRIDAERLYQEVRQMIRKNKGVDAEQDIPF